MLTISQKKHLDSCSSRNPRTKALNDLNKTTISRGSNREKTTYLLNFSMGDKCCNAYCAVMFYGNARMGGVKYPQEDEKSGLFTKGDLFLS
jgi:hypothetical protein